MDNIDIEISVPNNDLDLGRNNPTVFAPDYEQLYNKPQINDVTLTGNRSFDDLGLSAMTSLEIIEMYRRIINNAQ